MTLGRNDVPMFQIGPSAMVREQTPGTYDPETRLGSGGIDSGNGCRSINCSADGTISFYDFTDTLIEDYAVSRGENHIAIRALTAADVTVWVMF